MELLRRAVDKYSVQVIGDVRACRYSTLYYDTDDLEMYTVHQNRKLTRQKIRSRTYVESGITFIEVKNKTNKGRTKKKRIAIDESYFARVSESPEAAAFLRERANYAPEAIKPALATIFDRITLVNHAHTERLTIDMNLRFVNMRTEPHTEAKIDRMVTVELKQDGLCYSPMKEILQDLSGYGTGKPHCEGKPFQAQDTSDAQDIRTTKANLKLKRICSKTKNSWTLIHPSLKSSVTRFLTRSASSEYHCATHRACCTC